jgi:hypothetical protein
MTEGVARLAASDTRTRRVLERQVTGEDFRQSREGAQRERVGRVPGWERAPDASQLSATEARTIRGVVLADGEFTRAVQRLERNLSELSTTERIMGRLGQGSERYQEVQHALEVIKNQLRSISNMGNSIGAQTMAEHAVPDLSANVTAGAILRNVRAAQRVKHDYVVSLMESYGYHRGAGGGQGGGRGQRQQPSREGMEQVRLPSGATRWVTPEQAARIRAAMERQ